MRPNTELFGDTSFMFVPSILLVFFHPLCSPPWGSFEHLSLRQWYVWTAKKKTQRIYKALRLYQPCYTRKENRNTEIKKMPKAIKVVAENRFDWWNMMSCAIYKVHQTLHAKEGNVRQLNIPNCGFGKQMGASDIAKWNVRDGMRPVVVVIKHE